MVGSLECGAICERLFGRLAPGFGRRESAVHVGIEENAEVGRKLEVIKGKDVVPVCGGMVWIHEKRFEMVTRARKVEWTRWGE